MKWDVEVLRGDARTFHARQPDNVERPLLSWFEITRPALVLGSTQDISVVDQVACAEYGVDVVHRHSGGGAVLLVPDQIAWFDLIIPSGHERWDDDVSRAAWWVGDAVCQALADTGLADLGLADPGLTVHRGGLVRSPWSGLVCFAGLGPGEVVSGTRKLLGLSQRRTRQWIRYQCAVHQVWDPALLARLLRAPSPAAEELLPLVGTAELRIEPLLEALQS